jgi:hypothetical protein
MSDENQLAQAAGKSPNVFIFWISLRLRAFAVGMLHFQE